MPASRWTFARKAVCATLLVALAEWLFFDQKPGWTLGLFALAWTAGLVATVPALRQGRPATLLVLAAGFGLVLIDDPSPLAWLLFSVALISAALLPRHRFDDAFGWAIRLLVYGLIGLIAPFRDLRRTMRRRSSTGLRFGSLVALLTIPLLGSAVFLSLFAVANPVIEQALAAIEFPNLGSAIGHLLFWAIVLFAVWPSLRPRTSILPRGLTADAALPSAPAAPLVLTLAAFNTVFALQNGLDIAFLWNGARLPNGMSMTEYVHRGAYPLIVTALLAGLFVIVALRPGSASAANRTIRALVTLWVAQNIVLVLSSVLRTLRYIDKSMLTQWRIAALAWMALVALGLALILWRLLRDRSAAWLINVSAAAAAVLLTAASVVDLGAVAARWNVDHARGGNALDLCYLHRLGPSALLPLIDLERRAGGPNLRNAAAQLRADALADIERGQADWRSWTWRNARRLAAARTASASYPAPSPQGPRLCDSYDD